MGARRRRGKVSKPEPESEPVVPESAKELVQSLTKIVNFPEEEIYAMLVECDMNPDEAVDRLLSQGTFQEVQRKRNKKKEVCEDISKDSATKIDEAKSNEETEIVQDPPANKSEESEGVPESAKELVQRLMKIVVDFSETEIYAMLVECDMNPDEAVSRLLSQEVKTNQNQKEEVSENLTEDPADNSEKTASVQDPPANIPNSEAKSSSYNTQETGSVQDIPAGKIEKISTLNHWAGASSSPGIFRRQPPLNRKKAPTRFIAGVTSSWADLVKTGLAIPESSETQESGTKAPLLDDDVSVTIATGFQQLAIDNEEDQEAVLPKEPEMIIPKQLQVQTLGIGLNDNLETTQETEDNSSFRQPSYDQQETPQEINQYTMQQGYASALPSGRQDVGEFDLFRSMFQRSYNTALPSSLITPRRSQQAPLTAIPPEGRYPSMPLNVNPLALALQQARNHQSLAAPMLPQYRSQSNVAPASHPFAYGFGGGADSSSNLPLNHLVSSLQQQQQFDQQNESSQAWYQRQQRNLRVDQGNAIYSFPGHQSQHPPGFRQTQQLQPQPGFRQTQQLQPQPGFRQTQQLQQQPSYQEQLFEMQEYARRYRPQGAMSLENRQRHQQQEDARDASQQTQQRLWPKKY